MHPSITAFINVNTAPKPNLSPAGAVLLAVDDDDQDVDPPRHVQAGVGRPAYENFVAAAAGGIVVAERIGVGVEDAYGEPVFNLRAPLALPGLGVLWIGVDVTVMQRRMMCGRSLRRSRLWFDVSM